MILLISVTRTRGCWRSSLCPRSGGGLGRMLLRYHGKSLGALSLVTGGLGRLRRLGRVARRYVETGRAEALRAGGFNDARVCRYADSALTPDNLVIVAGYDDDDDANVTTATGASVAAPCSAAARAKLSAATAAAAEDDDVIDGIPLSGVVVHVNAAECGSHGSLPHRLAGMLSSRSSSQTVPSRWR